MAEGERPACSNQKWRSPPGSETAGIDDRWGLRWFPRLPVLLDADVEVVDGNGATVDAVESYTAMRTVDVRDGMVCLNGRPYPLRLVLDQGYWPDTGLNPARQRSVAAGT